MPILTTLALTAALAVLPDERGQRRGRDDRGRGRRGERQYDDFPGVYPQVVIPYSTSDAYLIGPSSSVRVTGGEIFATGAVGALTAAAQGQVTFTVNDQPFALCDRGFVSATGEVAPDARVSLLQTAMVNGRDVRIEAVETRLSTMPSGSIPCALTVTLMP